MPRFLKTLSVVARRTPLPHGLTSMDLISISATDRAEKLIFYEWEEDIADAHECAVT